MKRKYDTVYENILYKSFQPAYLFSKALGVMPLSYKRKRSLKVSEAYNRKTSSMEFEWSWKIAIYSFLLIALHIALKYYILISWKPPIPLESKENIDHGNSTSVNFTEKHNSSFPRHIHNKKDMWIVSTDDTLEFICTILVVIIGVFGARRIPDIFRELQHLDEHVDEDGYALFGKSCCLILKTAFPIQITKFRSFLRLTPIDFHREVRNVWRILLTRARKLKVM
jgi:hypothetical protein